MIAPAVEVIRVSADIWRIAVNKIISACLSQCGAKILVFELPVAISHACGDPRHLIDNFCYIRLGKTLRLVSKRHVECTAVVEANKTVEATTIEKEKVQRCMVGVETLTNFIVVGLAIFLQPFAF